MVFLSQFFRPPKRAEAMQDVFKYVDVFYNRKRRHASLGYVGPAEYEERYESTVTQAA